MAILKDFGKADNDRGRWFPFGEESPAPFDLQIRRIPYDVASRIAKRYGREQAIVVDGVRRPHIERSLEETTNWLVDQALWAWVDVRDHEDHDKGLQLEVADDDAVRLWSGLLKRDVTQGEVLDLKGSALTNEVKRRILLQIKPYAQLTDTETMKKEKVDISTFIIVKSAEVQVEQTKAEEASRGN